MKQNILYLCFVALLLAVGGCAPMSEGHLYGIAEQAVKTDSQFPLNASVGSIKDAEFFVGKNATCVTVPYSFTDESGQAKNHTYTVWLKRICVRWELDRCEPTPAVPPPEKTAGI